MTTEQLTQEVMKLAERQAKCDAEKENMLLIIEELKEDVKSTKSLAEDVHIMAINMKNMQETLSNTTKKVDAISSQEFVEYTENKKIIKQNILNKVVGAIAGIIITYLVFKLGLDKYM